MTPRAPVCIRSRSFWTFALLGFLLSPLPVAAQNLCAGLVTDKAAHPMSALAKPAVGQAVVDPQFGTTIRRVSAAPAGGIIKPMYSTISAWNADETRLILYRVGSGHQLYDGRTYQLIRSLDISPADIEQVYWHTVDPDILFYVDGNRFIRYHVSSGAKDVLTTFSCTSASGGSDPMYISWDSKRIGLECGANRLIYDMSTNKIVGSKPLTGEAPQVSPSGTLAFVDGTVYDAALNAVRVLDLGSAFEHASLGRTSDGHDTYYGVAFDPGPRGSGVGTLVAHDMTTGAARVVVGPATGYPYPPSGTHVSALAYKRPGYVAASIVGSTSGSGVLDQEIVLADTNPGGSVCRVAHHRSWADNGSSGYWGEPHAVLSPSGTRILFGSDWGNSGTVDAYVVELPSYGVILPPPAPAGLLNRYRLYSDVTKEHHYTTDQNEYLVLGTRGWVQEGLAHKVYQSPTPVGGVTPVPLYRAYSPAILQHLWTTDQNEYNVLGTRGWVQENVDGYILPRAVSGVTVPLYRLAHKALPLHLWTTDANEYAVLATRGWAQEGVVGHVVP